MPEGIGNKRICDFETLADAQDDDLILVSSRQQTFNMKVKTLKDATQIVANEAVALSKDAVKKATQANENAAAAVVAAGNAESDAATSLQATDELKKKHQLMSETLDGKVDDAYEENGYLYLTSGGEVVAGPLGPFAGSGGGTGGGSSGYLVSLKNLLESRVLTVSGDSAVNLSFQYTSADEDGNDDGPGVGTLTVNGVKAATINVPQGNNSIEISKYLVSGSNAVKVKVENSDGLSRTISYTVTVVSLSIETTFDRMGTYTGAIVFNYTVTGSGTKIVHFLMDGTEIGQEEVSSSGRSRSYAIPAQNAGAHILSAYAELTVDGVSVRSNTISIGMMWISETMSSPAVLSTFDADEVVHGENIAIPYMAYDPQHEGAVITLSVLNSDGSEYSSIVLTVDRSEQTWVAQNYPIGEVTFRISCGSAAWSKTVNVAESSVIVEPVTDALVLYFDPTGRSNLEDNPESWTDGNVAAAFNGVGFSAADGWLTDADGASILRILPGGEVNIPFQLFAEDARNLGATIEVEMATHNVQDYDTVVMSCMSSGRGFKIASQYAQIRSEQSDLSMQFKEDEKVRVSFVIEPRNLHRMIYVYVDGVMCGAIQYATADNFAQSPPVGITIGAESSGIDIYRVRLYNKGLTRHEILDNYIADRSLLSDRVNAAKRNDIFDLSENIVISKLPITLPYMFIKCAMLPQYKGDKKTCEIVYVNPADPSKSFTASGVQIDVQGTSSSGYKKKNWKLKLKNGLTFTSSGDTSDVYQLRETSIPADTFCMKADVASSEGANNVELVRLYNDTIPYRTPPQQADSRVRVGIDGLPCIIFWQNTTTGDIRFWGKYNFNDEKSSTQVYGLTAGCESWETLNNTSNRVLFKSSDFSDGSWMDDFEARYPEDNVDYTRLKSMCDWVVSTDRSAVNTEAEKSARLNKFRNEFEDHFVKAPMLYYYLFTEVFLMVDSRAKNFFPTTFDGVHWLPLPYDLDTAVGINNEGQLVFDYDLEDTDHVDDDNVFNAQDSVLWCNIRDAFAGEIKSMYNTLRSGDTFNYTEVVRRYAEHQAIWPESVWNEDAWEKYLEPLENDNDSSYLTMLQGPKASQREWWLYNGFRYRDSKYQCGDASEQFITLRCYQVGNITVTPYSHIWPRIKYGSYTVTQRGKRNIPVTLDCPLDNMNDTEVYIYSADRLSHIGDLSPMQVGYADFTDAVKLQSLKLGDGSTTYQNTRLTELYVGNNELLTSLDVQNCMNLAMSVDISGCIGIETVKAKGTAVTGFALPVGGKLKVLELPNTITNLTIRDQAQFTTLDVAGYGNLTTLRIENTPNIPYEAIINSAANLNRVRLINVEWTATSNATLQTSITKLKSCIGLDAAGNNTATAVVTGRVYVPSISAELLTEINEAFPQLVVVANGVPQYVIRYLDWDNTLLYRAVVSEGANAVNVVTTGIISAPERDGTEDTRYTFKDFGVLPTNIHGNDTVIAQYTTSYRVRFMNGDTAYNTQWIISGGNATVPSGTPSKASTPQYSYTFSKWSGTYTNVTTPVDITAVFTSTIRKYTVYFYCGSTLLLTVKDVPYGSTATYTGSTPVDPDGNGAAFEGWAPSNTNIQGNTSCYAQFAAPYELKEITDSWEQIFAAIDDGTYQSKYKVGHYKPIDFGTEGIINMQIAGFQKDELADGSGYAPISWIGKELLNTSKRMNPSLVGKVPEITFDPATAYQWSASEDVSNKFQSTNQAKGNTTSLGGWKVTPSAAGTLTVDWTADSEGGSYDYLDVYVDGVLKVDKKGGAGTTGSFTVPMIGGTVIQIFAFYRKDGSGDKNTDTATVTFSSDAAISIAAVTEVITIKEGKPATEGTGSVGGWEKTEMRAYMNGTIKPLIPENIRSRIKEVKKTHTAYDTDEKSFKQTTIDDVWMPDYDEMFSSSRKYKALFPDNASRKKYKPGATSASWWWLRSAYYSVNFDYVYSDGSDDASGADSSGAVAVGFCT